MDVEAHLVDQVGLERSWYNATFPEERHIRTIQNWVEELKRLVPTNN